MTQNMQDVAQIFSDKREEIIAWFAQQYRDVSPLLYSSVDIRDSGYKVAPVDTNIYPAGFNNLDVRAREKASDEMRKFFSASYPHAKKIGIIPENHTRNAGYISNLIALTQIIAQAGYEVVLGRVEDDVTQPVLLEGLDGQTITSYPFIAQDGMLATSEGFVPDVLVMNMDMTSGVPALLQHITQPIVPSVTLGWYQRRKSMHFSTYQTLVDDFASIMQVQPWLLSALHQQCGRVNFKEKTGLECVALNVERVLHQLRERYAQHEIQDTPYVFI
jgi:glutamate--cysteine ligase